MEALLHGLRAKGHTLFCLSNMPPASAAFLEPTFGFREECAQALEALGCFA